MQPEALLPMATMQRDAIAGRAVDVDSDVVVRYAECVG